MSLRSSPDRYGAVAIAIHWVSALAILALLASGNVLAATPLSAKAQILVVHASVGTLVLVLTLVRIAWWVWGDRRPLPVSGQPRWQEVAASSVHGLLYLTVLLLAASGISTLILSGALPALLGQGTLPDFSATPPRLVHGLAGRLMLALVFAHAGAALYHQFIRRDRLLGRMGIGPN